MRITVCKVEELTEASMMQVPVAGRLPVAVYKVKGQFYVTDDTCTHGKASLADEGVLDEHCVTCTWHDGQFDIRTGEPLRAPCTAPIRVYPVFVDGESVMAELSE